MSDDIYRQDDGQERILNCIPSRLTDKDWGPRNAAESNILDLKKYPQSDRDLSKENGANHWWKIEDQGTSGACVGYAVAAVLKWHFVNAKKLGQGENLSVRYLWMASKELDDYVTQATTFIEKEGTSIKTALHIAKKYGVVSESILPTNPPLGGLYRGSLEDFYHRAAQLRITSYYNLVEQNQRTVPRDANAREKIKSFSLILRRWIDQRGPVIARIQLDPTWKNINRRADGILMKYDLENASDYGHVVCLMGYKPKPSGDGEYLFKVQNSWGRRWALDGYAWTTELYTWMGFREAYGVCVSQ